jgi:hypothetical protein
MNLCRIYLRSSTDHKDATRAVSGSKHSCSTTD